MEKGSISVVVIGLNEGDLLRQSLESIAAGDPAGLVGEIIYVDSGSSDGSPELAAAFPGVEVLRLDDPRPTAAKGRNLGIARARGRYVQLLDGDCRLDREWLATGLAALVEHPDRACVFGRIREDRPDGSIYMRACQFDWRSTTGPADYCGGNALWRRDILMEVDMFDAHLPVGEEPDLCYRVRRRGHRVFCLDAPMVRHDLDMKRFGQYWRRALRSGRGYATLGMRYRRAEEKLWLREMVRNFLDPLVWLVLFAVGCWWGIIWGVALVLAFFILRVVRIAMRVRSRTNNRLDPWIYGVHCLFSRLPLVIGQVQGLLRPADRPAGAGPPR